jgi:hypothetical protein
VTERFVRPFIEEHFEYWRRRLDPALQLHPDCATSFLDRLSKKDNEPLLLALAAYQRAEKYEMDTSWANHRFWAAIRALLPPPSRKLVAGLTLIKSYILSLITDSQDGRLHIRDC